MRQLAGKAFALAAFALLVAGCALFDGGAAIGGTMLGYYFNITSDVLVTFTRGDTTVTVAVPVTSSYDQEGAFAVANLVPGDYAVDISFEADNGAIDGTIYSVDGAADVPVDDETVTGSSPPYTHTMTIDSLTVAAGTTLDIYFGNVE
jgi:hypothetical protein